MKVSRALGETEAKIKTMPELSFKKSLLMLCSGYFGLTVSVNHQADAVLHIADFFF